jgi:diguanylate cyclase (GGDEF)-like protein
MIALFQRHQLKFRHQLVLIFVTGVVALSAAIAIAVGEISTNIVREQMVGLGRQVTQTLANQSRLALLYQSEDAARDAVKSIAGFPDVQVLEIKAADGKTLYRDDPTNSNPLQHQSNDATEILFADDATDWIFTSPVITENIADDAFDAINGDDSSGAPTLLGHVAVSMSKKTLVLIQTTIFESILLITGVIALALALTLVRVSRRITTPIENLADTMRQARAGNTHVRAELRGQADVTDMQQAFNAMMDVLETREGDLKAARDAALELARVKGEFAANVTHELRTPMNAVLGMMDLLLDTKLSSRQSDYVKVAQTSGENLLALIEDILNFSKTDLGAVVVASEAVYLPELLDDVISLTSTQLLTKKLDIGYVIGDSASRTILTDASKLRQILINLIGNAIKFTRAGEVAISIDFLTGSRQFLRFDVKDTGIGIASEVQGKIFDAFTQADSSTTKEYGGTGLGLAICKQIVAFMGGEMGVTSKPGEGSLFWFVLPYVSAEADTAHNDKARSEPEICSGRALFVDASDIVRGFAVQQLTALGLDCQPASSCFSATTTLRQSRNASAFEFIFVDGTLFDSHDDDFAKMLASSVASGTKVVILINPMSGMEPQRSGFLRLDKPLRANALREFVQQHWSSVPTARAIRAPTTDSGRPPLHPLEVLIVDDNRVNQQVAIGMLEKLGFTCAIAADGREAVGMVSRHKYDLVLMDCHMPVMDGYEATAHIRSSEEQSGLPIIAMTANLGPEEEARCIAAGMTGFIAKPLRLDILRSKLPSWLPATFADAADDAQGTPNAGAQEQLSYDPLFMRELFDSVGDILYRMIEAFIQDTPVYLESLKGALAQRNAKQFRELAHTLKGSASNFGAHQFSATAKQLEALGEAGRFDEVNGLLDKLNQQFTALRRDLEEKILFPESDKSGDRVLAHRLLIVDDDRSIRMALKNIFEDDNFVIEEAVNGQQAVAICERKMPDMILMDAIMPELDGFKTCERIRQLSQGADIPILMITALDNEDDIVAAFAAGATDYVTKPLHFAVLKQRVARLVHTSKVEKQVKQLAYHDPLTGLPNRAKLMQELRLILNRAELDSSSIAVLFLDLDHFKNINDSLGHSVGDLLLKAVSDRLRSCVREIDFIARLGGDEFTVVLERLGDRDVISKVAQAICDALSKPFVFLQQKMFISTSVGISMYPGDGVDVNTLLKHADLAMFKAKATRNSYCFYVEGMEDEVSNRLGLEHELRYAIDHDQLVLHYQPQIDLKTGATVAAEALVRWQHPQRGLLGPGDFIALAEETDLIIQVTDWVLNQACIQISSWQRSGYTVRVAVNLSGKDLDGSRNLATRLAGLIDRHGIPPSLLELEITEGVLMTDPEHSRTELLELKRMGVTLAIDDFGSGYSSLSYLKNLPVDILKIDRSFILDVESSDGDNDRSVLTGIIALARSLRLTSISEGVETPGQREFIAAAGCDLMQGYLVSKPLPQDEFEKRFLADAVLSSAPELATH